MVFFSFWCASSLGHDRDTPGLHFSSVIDFVYIIFTFKKNNLFVNLTNFKGQTITKFSVGLIQKKKNKKQLRRLVKWMLDKAMLYISSLSKNTNRRPSPYVKVILNGYPKASFSAIKSFLKKLKLISFHNFLPIVHNGCRPPKKRRL